MNIIFLDIDGVLNSEEYFIKRNKTGYDEKYPLSEFDSEAVKRFNRIIKATNASIVISSAWRIGRTTNQLKELFKKVGINGTIIGKTPSLKGRCRFGETVRGDEIQFWMLNSKVKFDNYVILDDDNDMCKNQQNNFVKTMWKYGLKDWHVEDAIKILNK
jgi:hypothetical protein